MNLNKKNKIKYLKLKDLQEYFKIEPKEINEILTLLKWITKIEEGWKATKKGIEKGAKEGVYMGKSYIHWHHKIKDDLEIIDAVKGLKECKNFKTKKMSNAEKKKKGDDYEEYICNEYRKSGYKVAPHGKDNGVKDGGIDVIAIKNKEILFIQCKHWNIKSKNRITETHIKKTRMEVIDYIEENPMFKSNNYTRKTLYITSDNILHSSAKYYIKKHDDIEHKIIVFKE